MLGQLRIALAVGIATFSLSLLTASAAQAQIIPSNNLSGQGDSTARLYERLVNRLHATTQPQQDYLQNIVQKVNDRKLDLRLVVAVERYAIRRNQHYPFPFFERALKYEAGKRGITLPSIKLFQDQPIVTTPSF
ncbi:hypothetical protein LOC71_22665 [Rhodopirellula sp. JC740]|uniref:Uncharacterized protein n=1 Tax=Rhodopirellula halodulae TaxID=2894198 RepID=A0ABS8NNE4_9BACT|nr:hypothetical protein [Rhodopirellula sp. JC740]MCC9645091.1 hypothetical protein [Rhodopirellula sp. JC740]